MFLMLMISRLFKTSDEQAGVCQAKMDHKVPGIALEMTALAPKLS